MGVSARLGMEMLATAPKIGQARGATSLRSTIARTKDCALSTALVARATCRTLSDTRALATRNMTSVTTA